MTFHTFRHTCASIFIATGLNLKKISTYLGHSSITITLDRYGHLVPAIMRTTPKKIEAYLAENTAAW